MDALQHSQRSERAVQIVSNILVHPARASQSDIVVVLFGFFFLSFVCCSINPRYGFVVNASHLRSTELGGWHGAAVWVI